MSELEPTRTYSNPTATDVLRRMLDERGVEYEGGERSLRWRDRYGIMMQAFPLANGELGMGVWSCTPEQAIAATLGRGTLSASQVSNAVYSHSIHADCADADWQAIADELNNTPRSSNCTNSERMSDEPKPCPFCGSRTLYEVYHNVDGFDQPFMFCNQCKAMVTFEGYEDYVTDESDGMDELRAAWNRRADA